eukprot:scaffold63580_cov42-Phaeocystis_antarctica.AAC.1
MYMSGHHPATVRRAGRKRGASFESSEALAEQPAAHCVQKRPPPQPPGPDTSPLRRASGTSARFSFERRPPAFGRSYGGRHRGAFPTHRDTSGGELRMLLGGSY